MKCTKQTAKCTYYVFERAECSRCAYALRARVIVVVGIGKWIFFYQDFESHFFFVRICSLCLVSIAEIDSVILTGDERDEKKKEKSREYLENMVGNIIVKRKLLPRY